MYADFNYYSEHFPLLSEEEFDKQIYKAESVVTNMIPPFRLEELSEESYKLARLKDCICKVLNKIYQQGLHNAGNGVRSVSNDGYSETYTDDTQEAVNEEIYNLVYSCLSGTGLLSAH